MNRGFGLSQNRVFDTIPAVMAHRMKARAAVFGLAACLLASGAAFGEERKPAYSDKLSSEQLRVFAFQALKSSYPDAGLRLEDGKLVFKGGTAIVFEDGIEKNAQALLDDPDIFDMFFYRYPGRAYLTPEAKGTSVASVLSLPSGVPFPEDSGRIRSDAFFRAMYGAEEKDVRRRLARVKWLPSAKGQDLLFTTVNGADKSLQAVSNELDAIPELRQFLLQPGGTFNRRFIAGTRRLSVHSFGAAVDINIARSDYWRDFAKEETDTVAWRNRIPARVVEVFESHGFIWGGWWYHFDTMHFEYRPELMAYRDLVEGGLEKAGASR